jgi:hypothetical protein
MGEIVEVIERPSPRPGIVRFETNRALSGMGHDRYVAGERIEGDRPTDELARRIFATGGVASVHINGSVITVDLQKGYRADGIADAIRSLFTYYVGETSAAPQEAPTDSDAEQADTVES